MKVGYWIALFALIGIVAAQAAPGDSSCQLAAQAALDTQNYAHGEFAKIHAEINAISGAQTNMSEFKVDLVNEMVKSHDSLQQQLNDRTSPERVALPTMFAVVLGFAIAMAINAYRS